MSRFRILALFAAFAALALALAACGGSSKSSEDPQMVIDNATLAGVKSGNLDVSLGVKSSGGEGDNLDVSISGPFESRGKENLPQLGLTAEANGKVNGKAVDFEGGLTLLPERAFVNYKGTEYEVDPTTFGFVKSSLEQAQQQGPEAGSADVTACQEAAAGLKVGNFIEKPSNEGSAEVEGAGTTKISGELNVSGAIDALIKLSKNPACSAQLEAAGPLPIGKLEKAKGEVTTAVKKAHVDLYVGDDNIIRKLAAELTIEPKGGSEKVEVELELSLGGVNEEQSFSAPSGSQPLEKLFLKLGINPIELLEAGSGAGGINKLIEAISGGAVQEGEAHGSAAAPTPEGGTSTGGSEGGSGAGQKAYLECLKGAETPADLQHCASLIQ